MPRTKEILEKAKAEGRTSLLECEAKEICMEYGIPVNKFALAKNPDEAVQLAEKVGYPVVMKIVSPQIIHKSDVGGVILNIDTPEKVRESYDRIISNVKSHVPDAHITGILVQNMAPHGLEVIVGAIRDLQFGPTLMFGLGGVLVELLKDVSFRIAPVDEDEAMDMMREIKAFPLLSGYRGMEGVDLNALKDIIVRTSKLMMDNPEIKQLDLNPVFAYKDGAVVVDARILL